MPKKRKKFGRLKNITKTNIEDLPDGPGVYGIFDEDGKFLKTGRAKRSRAHDRIKESVEEIRKAKAKPKKFAFIPTKNVEDAKKLETELIRKRKPRFNIEKKGK